MIEIKLRDYQQELVDAILLEIENETKRILVQAETGSGKSVMIGELANKLGGRTLVLTHRVEILEQNSEWIYRCGILRANKNTVGLTTRVVVAMVETLAARIKRYGLEYIGLFDNILLDEIHINQFKKVFSQYRYRRIIGFTATPVTNRKETMELGDETYQRTISMSNDFDVLITGVTTKELIDKNFLVKDYNINLQLPNFGELRESSSQPDGYTTSSLNKVYNNRASTKILLEAIEEHCKGKKTLLFNSTTKNNMIVYDKLIEEGYNAKLYDSVNKGDMSRKEVVEWFRNERDAILVGTNVFTTGFNVTDIEVVIVNRATKSLTLWLQMVGRGARISDEIYKPFFTVIDLGQNLYTHGRWSKDRDWHAEFKPKGWKLKRAKSLIEVWTCSDCGALTPVGEVLDADGLQHCCQCGAMRKFEPRGSNGIDKDGRLVPVDKKPVPTARSIISYVKNSGNPSSNFAFRLLEQEILSLFDEHEVTYSVFMRNYDRFQKRIREIYTPCYFAIIRDEELTGANKRYETQLDRMYNLLNKKYGIEA